MVIRILCIGGISGIALSAWMYLWQQITASKVYTLLLNVDFIPFIRYVEWNEYMLNFFHIIISWAIVLVYYLWKKKIGRNRWLIAIGLSLCTACVYFPLSLLANQPVPAVDDWLAIIIWFSGHLLYGLLVVKLTNLFYKSKFLGEQS
ncbi:hypothetical protein CHH49_11245 [Terribacillus saccharophilus]|uniref:hypothetical protein n=1 Tax=Terribacillus saccharophilus TaxID=361277 RepID=UPI000BA5CB04|nr:hypothetical protein [Terribacillus saccharophilus]PAF21466.1 hypothetical protein CHH49_11245 [Terribacillus saccharophilus]